MGRELQKNGFFTETIISQTGLSIGEVGELK